MLEILYENFARYLQGVRSDYLRYFAHEIDMDAKMVGIVGPRGVGKTTFILQYLKSLDLPLKKKLYISADSIEIADTSLLEIAKAFAARGGEVLAIDEIHKYGSFEQELKNIYDLLPLRIIFSGSSALKLESSLADLSRRALLYRVQGLSYREFLEMKTGKSLPSFLLEEVLENHMEIAVSIGEKVAPLEHWQEYLQRGYYPFYFEGESFYLQKLETIVNTVIEVDLPSLFSMKYENILNLKKLVKLLCHAEPFKINISEMSRRIGIDRDTLYMYIDYLDRGSIFSVLRPREKRDTVFVKPEKIYLHHPNLYYSYCDTPKIGTVREAFVINQLGQGHTLHYPKNGDLVIDDRYTLEVGGKKKGFAQPKETPESFVAADDIVAGYGNKVPLWLFGFLY